MRRNAAMRSKNWCGRSKIKNTFSNKSILPNATKKAWSIPGFFVENIGVEPMTFWLPAKRSSQLS